MSNLPDRMPVPHSAAREIQRMILEGELKVDERLPAQRDLAKQLNISRASLREALLTLETLGFLRTEPGRGTFVSTVAPTNSGEMAAWRYGQESSMAEVCQTRLYLETVIVSLASRTLTAEDLAALETATDGMEAAWEEQDLIAVIDHDVTFHRIIVAACANPILRNFYGSLQEPIAETQRQPMPITRPSRVRESIGEHREILKALRARDSDRAAAEMHSHIVNTARCAGIQLMALPRCDHPDGSRPNRTGDDSGS